MSLFFPISVCCVSIAILLIGFIILLNDKKSLVNRTIFVLDCATALWLYSFSILYVVDSCNKAMLFMKLGKIGVVFIPVLFYNFVIAFTGRIYGARKLVLFLFYIISTFWTVCLYKSDYFLPGLSRYQWGYYPKAGPIYIYFVFYFVVAFNYSVYNLYDYYKINRLRLTTRQQLQLKYLFVAFSVTSFAALDFLPSFGINYQPCGHITIFLWVVITAYAMVKHQLMDINIIFKKTLVFAGLFIAVYAIFVFFVFLGQIFVERFVIANRWIAMIPSVIAVTFIFRPLEKLLVALTDRILLQKKYDYKELLKTFTAEVLTVLDLERLADLTIQKLADTVKLTSSALFLADEALEGFRLLASQGIEAPTMILKKQNDLIFLLEEIHRYILKSEKKISQAAKNDMEKLSADLILPLIHHDKLIGILSLGKKKSDEPYTQDDLDILIPLSKTLAIAISNAELFDQLSKTQAEAAQKEKMAVLGTLAAGMAHEIRNPITTIKIFSEFLKEKKDDPSFLEKFEELVPKEVEKINHMITHLLEFSRPADYKAMESVDLKEALKDVLDIVQTEMVLNDIILNEDIKDIPPVWGNRKYIQEIFFNLIQNAIHAIGRRGTIIIAATTKADAIEVQVEDTGCGIPKEHLEHLFEPFFTTKLDSQGVGLGLYVVKQLMMRMGGNIVVSSEVGKGTVFTLRFVECK